MQEMGCKLRSKLVLERDPDGKNKLTHWLTRRRIIYRITMLLYPGIIHRWDPSRHLSTIVNRRTFDMKQQVSAADVYVKKSTRLLTGLTLWSADSASPTDTGPVTAKSTTTLRSKSPLVSSPPQKKKKNRTRQTNENHQQQHLSLNREGRLGTNNIATSFPPFFPVLHCPLGLGKLQACPFPDVVFPPLLQSALYSPPFHCPLQDGSSQTVCDCLKLLSIYFNLCWCHRCFMSSAWSSWHWSPCLRLWKLCQDTQVFLTLLPLC